MSCRGSFVGGFCKRKSVQANDGSTPVPHVTDGRVSRRIRERTERLGNRVLFRDLTNQEIDESTVQPQQPDGHTSDLADKNISEITRMIADEHGSLELQWFDGIANWHPMIKQTKQKFNDEMKKTIKSLT